MNAPSRRAVAQEPLPRSPATLPAPAMMEPLLQKLLQHSHEVLLITDADGRMQFASSGVRQLLDVEPESLLGRHIWELGHPEQPAAARREWATFVARPGSRSEGRRRIRVCGRRRLLLEWRAHNLLQDAAVGGIVLNVRDVTASEQAQAALHASEERYRALIEHAADAVLVLDERGAIRYASPAILGVSGYAPAELQGCTLIELVHPDDAAATAAGLAELLRRPGDIHHSVRRYRRKDGSWCSLDGASCNLLDNPAVRGIVVNVRDISDRVRTECALRESERRFKSLLDNVDQVSVMLDTQRKVIDCNDFLLTLTGWRREEVIGSDWMERFIPPERRGPLQPLFDALLQDDPSAWHHENEILTRSGELRLIRWSNTILRSPNGEVTGSASLGEDVTERRTLERERTLHAEAIRVSLEQAVQAVASALEQRDPYTAGHSRRVAQLSGAIAAELGIDDDTRHGIELAAQVHDLGKIGIPIEILSKPGPLSPLEFALIQTHAEAGYAILRNVHFPWPIAEMVRQHHERLDGSGYPRQLRGDEILPGARIIAVADVVEATAAHRPYRAARGLDEALDLIREGRGRGFDTAVVDACLRLFKDKGFRFPGDVPINQLDR